MPEEEIEQREEKEESRPPERRESLPERRRRRYFTRRNALISGGLLAILAVLLSVFTVVFYRYGVFDTYVKTQFVAKMADIGIVFDADVFRVTVAPLELELKNATFNDRITGEKLFFIRDARLGLSVTNLYSWQLSRDISVDTTDIYGLEAWVRFDENGRSNFSNLKFVEDERGTRVNFKYQSIKVALKDSVIHFGDISRKIEADANNVQVFLEPENYDVPDEQKRYKIEIATTDSMFVYDGHPLEDIDIRARGIADRTGAEITELKIETPIGVSTLNGTLTDWASLQYNFNVESTVDLTQTSTIFPVGTAIRGVGNFKGNVSGQGETYRIDGKIDSESLTAEGIYLKAVNVAATVEGTNANYEANGNAVAELLTFGDFRIEFPKISGNVRGTGTDFRWVGELQAAAAKSKSLTLGGLFLSDAVAEYKDRQLQTSAGSGRAQKFSVADTEFANLAARNLKFAANNGVVDLTAESATADSFKADDYSLQGVTGRNLRVKDANNRTDVDVDNLTARSAQVNDARLQNLRADRFRFTDHPNSVDLEAANLRAERLDANGTRIEGLDASLVTLRDTPAETLIISDRLRVAKVDAGAAVLGSLNVAGVRLTIRQGTIQGTSADIDAGDVTLKRTETLPEGGTLQAVKIYKPVFVLEPSGRYRVTADMSLGGGMIGSVDLGAARADVAVNNDRVALTNLTADVMEGRVEGNAAIAFNSRTQSNIQANFTNLDLGKLLALQGGRIVPIEGQTTGTVDLSFSGTNFRTASGTAQADIVASAGSAERGLVPITGRVEVTATNGLFNIDQAKLNSEKSELTATGVFDLRNDDSNLNLALRSTDGSEIDRIVRVLGISPDLEQQMDSLELQLAGNVSFDGKVTGNLTDPTIDGKAAFDSVSLRGRQVGTVTSDLFVSPAGIEIRNGMLQEPAGGGNVAFSVSIPYGGTNNTSVQATLTNVNAGNLLAALPIDLPERLRDFTGQTSGTVNLTGLPNESQGAIDLASAQGTVAGQAFDSLRARAVFSGTQITLESGEIRIGTGFVTAAGTYDRVSTAFDLDLQGKTVPLPLALSFLPANENIPTITGTTDFTAKATGIADRSTTYNVNFDGVAQNVFVNESALGEVTFKGNTANQVLNADLTASFEGRPQTITASVNFADENLPFRAVTEFNNSPLGPFFAFIPQLRDIAISGTGTGRVEFGGNLRELDAAGNRIFSAAGLSGTADFTQLALVVQETPLNAAEPIRIRFSPREIVFDSARFSGGGSNMTISGTKALADDAINNFSVDGRVNLTLLNLFLKDSDAFFAGTADVAVRITGPNATARLSGTATTESASVSTFIGSDRLTFDRVKARVLFTSNQAQIDEATGFLGGGRFVASGGALLEGFRVQAFRMTVNGNNVTVPLPEDFVTTGDANLEITGQRPAWAGRDMIVTITGRVAAKRSLYTQDIELANIVGVRRDPDLSSGGGSTRPLRFDLIIEGRDALIVRNNIADLTASVSLRLAGDSNNPRISGRITANSGTILFRKDRYEVQRGVLEFPPETAIEPIINLQAETEIAGYQIFVNLAGPLTDTELLSATVRSSPALPQADVVSLITTGNLSNTASGIPTLAQTGINTAADILTDAIISNPARKATDKLFGLNVFEIDPIISGERLNPTARLTVGRQINNNLRVTYATNLSQDQNQVLALEYRVSNKLSFVAQYEQRSLSNVTRNRDNFSFEIRFRRRF